MSEDITGMNPMPAAYIILQLVTDICRKIFGISVSVLKIWEKKVHCSSQMPQKSIYT